MDQRHSEIKTGEGLQESRLNQELINFLQKWSTPVLLVIVALSLGWTLLRLQNQRAIAKKDAAFEELALNVEGADVPSPGALRAIAEEYEDVGSVAEITRLRLADLYIDSVRAGVAVGAQPQQEGEYAEEDILSEDDETFYLSQAEDLYAGVLQSSRGENGKSLLAVNAAFGLAAVAESRGELDAARGHYETAIEIAESTGLAGLDQIARDRVEGLESLADVPRLYSMAELPRLPGDPEPQPDVQEAPAETPEAPLEPDIIGPTPGADVDIVPPPEPNTEPEPEPEPEPEDAGGAPEESPGDG